MSKYNFDTITIKRCEDERIWITNNKNSIGTEHYFDKNVTPNINEEEELIIAFANHLNFEPSELLNLDNVFESNHDEVSDTEKSDEVVYLDNITGTIGQWLDNNFDNSIPSEVITLLQKAYELSAKLLSNRLKT